MSKRKNKPFDLGLIPIVPLGKPIGKLFYMEPSYSFTADTWEDQFTPEELEAQAISDIEDKIKEEIGLPVYKVPEEPESQLWEPRVKSRYSKAVIQGKYYGLITMKKELYSSFSYQRLVVSKS